MYSLEQISKGISQPYFILREINRLISSKFGRYQHNPNGIDIFSEDWDNLIILDACRYDTFKKIADLPGKTQFRESRAGATKEYIQANFCGKKNQDTVYITGNSWIFKLGAESSVHKVYDVLEDPDEGTKPELITDCAMDVSKKYQDKRLIIHFIRPHHPFIGPKSDEFFNGSQEQPPDLYNQIQNGDVQISDNELQELYEDNLRVVLPKVMELLESLQGKTVVTADHGELLGERVGAIPIKTYGHIPGFYPEELVKVPWHIYQSGERKDITEEGSAGKVDRSYSASEKTVDERLRDLGYKT